MTDLPPPAATRPARLLLIRVLIVVGVLLAIAMGLGIALQSPPPEATGAAPPR